MKRPLKLLLLTMSIIGFACNGSDDNAATTKQVKPSVSFENLRDNQNVKNPFLVKFGVTGMTVADPEKPKTDTSGHHHLIIDDKPVPYGTMIPMDAQHLHFMKGETEHTLSLKPGKHTLTLQFGGTNHQSFGEPLSKTITVNVSGEHKATETTPAGGGHEHHNMHGTSAAQQIKKATDGSQRIFFIAPKNGQHVPPSLSVRFGAEGFTVTPAGQLIDDPTRGHHHLIIDGKAVPKGTVVPADDQHIHFGKGQLETRIALSEGKHTLTLQFADGAHRSYGPEFSETIEVNVVPMHVFFETPPNNATIPSDAIIRFGTVGVKVTPAGQHMDDTTRGHHHIIIDGKPVPRGDVVPADKTHVHFGKGQQKVTVKELNLTPGKHTLTLQFADGAHRSLGPEMSKTIQVEVKDL